MFFVLVGLDVGQTDTPIYISTFQKIKISFQLDKSYKIHKVWKCQS